MSTDDSPRHERLGPDAAARFWRRVERPDGGEGGWLWNGARNRDGYSAVRVGVVVYLAHRLACVIAVGPVPATMFVTHTCRSRARVRPDHLALRPRRTRHDRPEP